MPADMLGPLQASNRVLFAVPLRPLQGQRFQPTGFPNLGAATYRTSSGTSLLVESAQSMANRLELTCWDSATNAPVPDVAGISHVTVTRKGKFLTDSMLEAHRLNSPYLLEGKDKAFFNQLKEDLGGLEEGPIDRQALASTLLKYDIGSLLHGVFLAKKELAGGRLRVARAVSAFIEAEGVSTVASGGVKNDHVHPGRVAKDPKNHFGNIPFARDEYTADEIRMYANVDLGQIRGYGLGDEPTRLLVLLGLYKLRMLLSGSLRLRTACDLEPTTASVVATAPKNFELPDAENLAGELMAAVKKSSALMKHVTVKFDDELKKASDERPDDSDEESEDN